MKCSCGYECRFPGEAEMLDQWGCAKAAMRKSGPFNSLEVIMCSRDSGNPELTPVDNGEALKAAFAQKYEPKTKPDANTKVQ